MVNMMNTRRRLASAGLLAGLICALSVTALSGARAADPNQHPHYLHAQSDLRFARGWLTALGENNVMGREMDGVANIDKAIHEINRADIDDGKDIHDHPPIDTSVKHKGRLHKALDLLQSSKKDLEFNEDDKAALGWRKAALKHVQDAIKAVHGAINDVKNDS
jgi:hypothetical protein